MKICCISDIHGNLNVKIEPVDILIIAGDILNASRDTSRETLRRHEKWLCGPFKTWLDALPAKEIVAIAGNHDAIFERRWTLNPQYMPKLKWHYLQDSGTTIMGLNFWGSPWSPYFLDWFFNAPEEDGEEFLEDKWSLIPDNTDILVVHGPPHGYGDQVIANGVIANVGSTSLLNRIKTVNPKLGVFGHIHSGHGVWQYRENGFICNASVLDEQYKLTYQPKYFDISDAGIVTVASQ